MKPISAIIALLSTFGISSLLLYLVAKEVSANFFLEDVTRATQLRYPSNLNELKELASLMKYYKDANFWPIMLMFCCAYLYKQAFAIPGSFFLNVLSGALFGMWTGFPLVCLLTAVGATACYTWSKVFGKSILQHFFPDKLTYLQKKVDDNTDGIFFFLLCLRLFPMSPNWFLNMSSPILGIPVHLFFASVLVGLIPYNFMCCQAGCILSEITSLNQIMTPSVILRMFLAAILVAGPGFLIRNSSKSRPKTD
ncbi:transmembrane protein 41A-A-like [Rhopilema esculentum]|uniref:transmembrane protein 41A-A-like n=1 Tax=Rhopilema esculentum TaxID=499914 RepID=UPI0031D2D8D4